jgi:hypothetical protein
MANGHFKSGAAVVNSLNTSGSVDEDVFKPLELESIPNGHLRIGIYF